MMLLQQQQKIIRVKAGWQASLMKDRERQTYTKFATKNLKNSKEFTKLYLLLVFFFFFFDYGSARLAGRWSNHTNNICIIINGCRHTPPIPTWRQSNQMPNQHQLEAVLHSENEVMIGVFGMLKKIYLMNLIFG